ALARLFRLPTTWADLIADWKILVLSSTLDALVITAMIFYEVLGWPTREEKKRAKQALATTAPTTTFADVVHAVRSWLGRLSPQPQIVDITPEPAPPRPARVPDRPRPRLAVATKQ